MILMNSFCKNTICFLEKRRERKSAPDWLVHGGHDSVSSFDIIVHESPLFEEAKHHLYSVPLSYLFLRFLLVSESSKPLTPRLELWPLFWPKCWRHTFLLGVKSVEHLSTKAHHGNIPQLLCRRERAPFTCLLNLPCHCLKLSRTRAHNHSNHDSWLSCI